MRWAPIIAVLTLIAVAIAGASSCSVTIESGMHGEYEHIASPTETPD